MWKECLVKRSLIEDLLGWKEKKDKKPLIIKGARQVGKTWIMKEFGKIHYEKVAYINFDGNHRMSQLFSGDFDIARIISGLEIESSVKIAPKNTLIILDEIQECHLALSSLKYFHEKAPDYSIVSAGSMLGVALHSGTSFPVGKVDFLELYPLSFSEFLLAMGEEPLLNVLQKQDFSLINTFRDKYINLLHTYYFVGGMPEAVSDFALNGDFQKVRSIQRNILAAYEHDFSKHVPVATVTKLRMLWSSILAQLAKENKKFIYGAIKKGARAKEYETAITWLEDCGLIYKINRINAPLLPLRAYEDISAFKLFILDIGLLAAMGDLDAKTLLDGDSIFREFKGALTEQYVLQQLKNNKNMPISYWANDSNSAEIDFVIQLNGTVVPVEAKASINLKAKSLKSYMDKFNPKIAVRTSAANYKQCENLYDVPLYMIENIAEILCD